ncbi:hypothetical protein GCM10027321_17260 [Massilia terrae]|uniref:Lipoprotein n=1 Tax=Massilia terrae TaxID=1811224 RepID=A0ABT2CYF7_9BURK|nr:hypothetical protein [Massilia terrae]MCS0658205.1 hypothetical protein [Massilia terrae]
MNIRTPALLAAVLLAGCSSMGYGTSGTRGNTQSTPPQQGQQRDDVNAAVLPLGPAHVPDGNTAWRAG